jgi:hypothetical protein
VELMKRWSVTVAVELMQAMPSILIVFLTALSLGYDDELEDIERRAGAM